MRGRLLATGTMSVLALLVGSNGARADGTLKLVLSNVPAPATSSGISGGGEAMTLQLNGDADTVPVWGHRGYWGGGYRGYWGGGYRGYWGGYGGYGGYGGWGGYYPRYYSYGGYYPRYYGGYYGGFYPGYSNYYPRYYGYYPSFYWGCSIDGGVGAAGEVTVLNGTPATTIPSNPQPYSSQPVVPQQPSTGTYPYNGGPTNPVPAPGAEPRPTNTPQPTVPLEGRVVSLPSKPAKYVYPAYGEQPTRTPAVTSGTLVIKR